MEDPLKNLLDSINKLFSTTELVSAKVEELNKRIDYLASFIGLEEGENEKSPEPPGQLAGLSLSILDKTLPPQKANTVKAYILRTLAVFRHYIKSIVLFGSAKRKEDYGPNSDIDIAFIVDPSDVSTIPPDELNSRLFGKLSEIAAAYSDKIHPQGWTIVDLWRGIVKPDPVMLTLLRDGIAIYDTGFFYSLQKLYKEGLIVPTISSIDSLISQGEFMLNWAQDTLTRRLANDLFLAVTSSSQAMLMEYGYMPPVPKEVPKALYEVFVTKEKLLDAADVRGAEEVITWWKKIEKGEIAQINGKDYEEKFNIAKSFVEKAMQIIINHRKAKGLPSPAIVDFAATESENTNINPKTSYK
ncbi:MAG: nucleotidyltransferase domain-containing protein [Candidatus Rehaiarchaeum fermentans]|nr:nucleotidyltransferase domain-containing protein [Candidatus Rehaiarchaeum fermentans]MCW1302342.1 nucleotidyltransferase domain-containing protein [Candidatus Rehaiarchaeum fermentans]